MECKYFSAIIQLVFVEMREQLRVSASEMLTQTGENIVEIVPQIFLAAAVFIIGIVLALAANGVDNVLRNIVG